MKQLLFLLYLSLALPIYVWASDDHGHDEHGEHEENETIHVVIDPEIARQTGINVTQAKSGTLERTITVRLTGSILESTAVTVPVNSTSGHAALRAVTVKPLRTSER